MSVASAVLQALEILAPVVEHLVEAIIAGKGQEALAAMQISDPLKSRVALAAKRAGLK